MTTRFDTGITSPQPTINAARLPVPAISARGVRRACQRGMATAEYAVGILAAVALALVLLGIFKDSAFVDAMLKLVIDLIGKAGALIP